MLPFEPMRPARRSGARRRADDRRHGGDQPLGSAPPRARARCATACSALKLVNGRGETIRCGGRVMKNVTGLDLAKLNCGAHGTLGLLTEATFKLLPRPEAEATLVVPELGESTSGRGDDARRSARPSASAARPGSPRHGREFSAHRSARRGLRGFRRLSRRAARRAARANSAPTELAGEDSSALWRAVRDAEFIAEPARSRGLAGEPRSLAGGRLRRRLGETALAHFLRLGRRPRLGRDRRQRDGGGRRFAARAASAKGHATLIRAPDSLRAAVDVFEPPSALACG